MIKIVKRLKYISFVTQFLSMFGSMIRVVWIHYRDVKLMLICLVVLELNFCHQNYGCIRVGLGWVWSNLRPKLYRVLRFGWGKITIRYIIRPVWINPLIFGLDWAVGYPIFCFVFIFSINDDCWYLFHKKIPNFFIF